jgi:hypothetical protein
VIYEKKIGTDGYGDYPSNIITTSDQKHILSISSIKVTNNNDQYATLYSLSAAGEIINNNTIIKEDTAVAINYISNSFTNNSFIGVGRLRHNNNVYLWIFEFNSILNIIKEHKILVFNAIEIFRAYIEKSGFDFYITYEYVNQNEIFFTKMLHYQPYENDLTFSNWEMYGNLGDFTNNNFDDDGFFIGGTFLNRSMTTIWAVSQEMELIFLYDDFENDIYHQIDFNWTYNNKLIHAGSHYNPDYELTRFMGIQILDSNLNAEHFRSFGQIGLWNYAASNESVVTYGDNTIYFTGTQGVIMNSFPAYDNHIAIHKMDTTLSVDWSYLIGGDAYYLTRSINTTSDGGCIIAATRYDEALQNQEYDVYLIAMGPDGLATNIDSEINNNKVVLYPNPGKNLLNLDIREKSFVVHLYNNTGQLVLTKENQCSINTSALSSGIYFYRITKDSEILSSGKWIKR